MGSGVESYPPRVKHAATHLLTGNDPLSLVHTQISDWTEAAQDLVAAALVEGAGVTITYDDTAGTITINATAFVHPPVHELRGQWHSNLLLVTGALAESVVSRQNCANQVALVTGRELVTAIVLPGGIAITSITFVSGSTPLNTGTHQIFTIRNTARTLLAQTRDATNEVWAASTPKALGAAGGGTLYTTPAGDDALYYLGCLVAASTVPTLIGSGGTASAAVFNGVTPVIASLDTNVHTDGTVTSTVPVATTNAAPYAYVS